MISTQKNTTTAKKTHTHEVNIKTSSTKQTSKKQKKKKS